MLEPNSSSLFSCGLRFTNPMLSFLHCEELCVYNTMLVYLGHINCLIVSQAKKHNLNGEEKNLKGCSW